MANTPALSWKTVNEGHIKDIYDSDQAMYPAPQLSYSRLRGWVDACPELCLCLQRGNLETSNQAGIAQNDAIHGLIIVLPLRQPYWDRLLCGDIEEHDVDALEMFPAPLKNELSAHPWKGNKIKVGLHVFHIERFRDFGSISKGTSFTPLALEEISGRVMKTFQSWEVVGYSGELKR